MNTTVPVSNPWPARTPTPCGTGARPMTERPVNDCAVRAALTVRAFSDGADSEEPDLPTLVATLSEQVATAADGGVKGSQATLAAQALTLDHLFHHLMRRAADSRFLETKRTYLSLALRAQAQSRATLEALATIKNPPMVGYVRQANITQGPQQVNNTLFEPPPGR